MSELSNKVTAAMAAINNAPWAKNANKFCLTCNGNTRNLNEAELEELLNRYRANGRADVKIETKENGQKFILNFV